MDHTAQRRLLRACYSVLVPIARFLLRSGVGLAEFNEISRIAFVKVGSEDYGIRGRPTNASRIAAMTGISRREVARVRKLADEYEDDPRIQMSPLGDVLHYWYTNPEFLDDAGHPMTLPFSGQKTSFERLVQLSAPGVTAGAMRVELVRIGAVRVAADGLMVVNRRHAVPEEVDERLLTSIAFNLRGLAETIAYNSDPVRRGPGRIERFVQSGYLTESEVEYLRQRVRERILRYTEDLDDSFTEYDRPESRKGKRIGVGIFYYEGEN